jgi:hypothetical protein
MVAALSKAGATPGPQAAPEGSVSRYADGTVVEKRGGKWQEVKTDKGKPDADRPDAGGGKKSDPKTKRRSAKKLLSVYRQKLDTLSRQGGSKGEIAALKTKIKTLKQKMRGMAKAADPFAAWEKDRVRECLRKSAAYCKYLGYSNSGQLLYAVAAGDTPADVTVAVRAATKYLGEKFGLVLEKELAK